jgi:hypothetical protein
MENSAKSLIKYFKSLGIKVYTNTKARGHQGFFLKNRIDVSKNTPKERFIPTLLHEFAHFINNKLEHDIAKSGGSIEVIFKLTTAEIKLFENELLLVTNFVDENSLAHKFKIHKEKVKKKIKLSEEQIKKYYPYFMRSKKFKEFDKYIKKSKAKYLLKYDKVKFISPFLRREEIFSVDTIEQDFPQMPQAFCAYIRLKSAQRKQGKISKRINHLNKYYLKPAELFARFIEGIYLDNSKTKFLAPTVYERFFYLLEKGHYQELKTVFEILNLNCFTMYQYIE